MHPGDHTRKKLSGLFWSETNDKQALKNLRTVLSSIRQVLPSALYITRDALSIHREVDVIVDASLFESECIRLLSQSIVLDQISHMEQLASLYQGAFLVDASFRDAANLAEWIDDKQRQLQQLYTRLLYEIITLKQESQDYEGGLGYAWQLITVDPYWDAARCQLMRLLVFTNRANEALMQYEAFAKLLADELDTEPDTETRQLYEQIRSRHLRTPVTRTRSATIILPDMPFVESPDDMTLAQRMLNTPQCHLLTIYGISGVGKTALATQIAYQRQTQYADGAYLIALKSVQSARDLPYIIANTLNIDFTNQTTPAELEQVVLSHLKDRHLLLVLDNYEHLLPETIFMQKLLEETTRVQCVVTSQAPLNLFREWLLPLQGLRIPTIEDTHPEEITSVKLFELTARRIDPRFDLQNVLPDIIEICQLVDGLPLAIILAATWTQVIPIHKIKDYIIEGQAFSLPVQRELPPHHQSLEMMLEYTWNTLSSQEQHALMALSIFNVSFDLDLIQRICNVDLMTLTSMIQKALIQRYGDRYRMHQLIWRYARKKLIYSDVKDHLARQYLQHIVEQLNKLQQERLPLHEYIMFIENQYAFIWNYDWMARSFQTVYILTLSRYLFAYWEISRRDELATIKTLFEGMSDTHLPPDLVMVLYLQRARLYFDLDQLEPAHRALERILTQATSDTLWADWGTTFTLCWPLLQPKQRDSFGADQHDDASILSETYHTLLALYLDMRDYDASNELFVHLRDHIQQPLDLALVSATQAAVSAEIGETTIARTLFNQALSYLDSLDTPTLTKCIQSLYDRL